MSQLTARIIAGFAVTVRPTSQSIGSVDLQALAEFYYGSGAAEADALAYKSYTINASQTQTINLASWIGALIPSGFTTGSDVELSAIKALYVRNASALGGATVEVGGTFIALAGAAIPLAPAGSLLIVNPSAAGWAVTSPGAVSITIENLSGAASATVEVAAIGVSV